MGISRKAMVAATWATSLAVVAGGGVAWSNVQQAAAGGNAVNVCVRVDGQAMRLETDAKPCKLKAPKLIQEERISLAPADAVEALASRLDRAESTISDQGDRLTNAEATIANLTSDYDQEHSKLDLVFLFNASNATTSFYVLTGTGSGLKPGSDVTVTEGTESTVVAVVAPDGTFSLPPGTTQVACHSGPITVHATAKYGELTGPSQDC